MQDPRTGQKLGTGPRVGRMFPVDNFHLPPIAPVSVATTVAVISSLPSLALWHSCLSHASSSRVQQLASRRLLGSVSKDNFDCTSCQLGKQLALSFNNSESISDSILELIYSDVWDLLLLLVLVDLDILLFLLMIILVIVGSFL